MATDVRSAVVGGVVLRLALLAAMWLTGNVDRALTPDSPSYLVPAASLARGAGALDSNGAPALARPPGYPLLLVPGQWLGAPVAWALLLQVGLAAVLIAQVGRLALDSGLPARGARVAAWLCACDPWLVVMTTRVMSEVACVLALTLGLRHATRAMLAPGTGTGAAQAWRGGAWLAVAAYLRPLSAAVWAVVALGLAFTGTGTRRRTPVLACALAFLVLVAPWHVRNGLQAGYWGFSTMTSRVLYLTLGGTAQAALEGRAFQDVRLERLSGAAAVAPAEMTRRGLAALAAAPGPVLAAHAAGMVRVVADPGGIELLRTVGWYPTAGGLLGTIQEEGVLAGLMRLGREQPLAIGALGVSALGLLAWPLALAGWPTLPPSLRATWAALILVVVLLSGGVHANGRFRVPLMPVLAVMAAAGTLRLASLYTPGHG